MDDSDRRIELVIEISTGPDVDDAEIEEFSRELRHDLLELDVDDVAPMAVTAPDGSKPGDPVTWQTLLVTLSASGGVLTSVIAAVSAWMRQRQNPPPLVLKIDGDSLTLPAATSEERRQLLQAFVDRHERPQPRARQQRN